MNYCMNIKRVRKNFERIISFDLLLGDHAYAHICMSQPIYKINFLRLTSENEGNDGENL